MHHKVTATSAAVKLLAEIVADYGPGRFRLFVQVEAQSQGEMCAEISNKNVVPLIGPMNQDSKMVMASSGQFARAMEAVARRSKANPDPTM